MTLTAKIRLDCLALGIQRIDAGPAGIAAGLRPGAAAPAASDLISRSGDRLVYKQRIGKGQTPAGYGPVRRSAEARPPEASMTSASPWLADAPSPTSIRRPPSRGRRARIDRRTAAAQT